jgi:hypothetical protein
VFRPLPKRPLELSGFTPPAYVELPDGRVRYVIEEPLETEPDTAEVIPLRQEGQA